MFWGKKDDKKQAEAPAEARQQQQQQQEAESTSGAQPAADPKPCCSKRGKEAEAPQEPVVSTFEFGGVTADGIGLTGICMPAGDADGGMAACAWTLERDAKRKHKIAINF